MNAPERPPFIDLASPPAGPAWDNAYRRLPGEVCDRMSPTPLPAGSRAGIDPAARLLDAIAPGGCR